MEHHKSNWKEHLKEGHFMESTDTEITHHCRVPFRTPKLRIRKRNVQNGPNTRCQDITIS
jgi:hypothetical protein